MIRTRKFVLMVVVASMLISLFAGCGVKSEKNPSDSQSQAVQSTSTDTSNVTGGDWGNIDWKQFKGTELNVLATSMPVTEIYKKHLSEFEELTGIKVNLEVLSDSDRRNKQLVDFKAGNGQYDVSNVGISNREEFAVGNNLESLMPYIENTKLTDPSWYNIGDYPTSILDGGKSGDNLVMVPFTAEYFLLWYRTDVFETLGLTPPKTLVELEATATKIEEARNAGKVDTYAFIERTQAGAGEAGWDLFCTANRFPIDLVDFKTQTSFINTEDGMKVMDYYSRMCKNFGPPGSQNWGWTDIGEAFKQGTLAMVCGGNASAPSMADPEQSSVADKVNFAPIPMEEGGKDPLWEWGWALNANSKNKEAGWLLIEWLTSPNLMKVMGPEYGCPARESIYSDPDYIKAMPSKEFIDAQIYMMTEGVNPSPSLLDVKFAEAADIISKELSNIVSGIKDTKTACADAETALEKIGYTAGT